MTGRARICTQADSSFVQAGEGAEQRAQGVDLVVGAQRVVLGQSQAQLAAGGDPVADQRRAGRGGLGAGAGPGRLDGPFDQAGRDGAGHPQRDGEPAVGGGQLEAEVGLAAERPPPGRAQQGHQVGPQGRRPLGVDLGRGQHPHQAGALRPVAARLPAAHDGHGAPDGRTAMPSERRGRR